MCCVSVERDNLLDSANSQRREDPIRAAPCPIAPSVQAPKVARQRIWSARRLVNGLLLLAGLYGLWSAGWIHVKAELAQWLIARAWNQSLATPDQAFKPWYWADTQPVAKLVLPNGESLIVLRGAQGNSLAFGPGLVEGSALPGLGFAVVGGHRDTHFASLEQARPGQQLRVQTRSGDTLIYQIDRAEVIDIHTTPLAREQSDNLLLVTCYPFHSVNSDPNRRWVVSATPYRVAEGS